MRPKLALIATHPIQYYAPWFTHLSKRTNLSLRVFYLWDSGAVQRMDRGFGVPIQWDIPLLEGYDYEYVANASPCAGTGHFLGLWNPDLVHRVKEFGPDAVLFTTYNYASIIWFLWCWRNNPVPFIFRGDSHRLVPRRGLLEGARRGVITRIFRCFDAVLYVGAANRDYFKIHQVPDARLFFSPHAIDVDRFTTDRNAVDHEAKAWKHSLGIPDDHRVILFAGKFEEKKRPLDLLQAFLSAGLEKTFLLYVGSGALEPSLRALAGDHPQVYFAPFQNQSLMPRTYASCDVFVLPSAGPAETWGLAVNEAMCMGRPAIVSSHVGCAQDLVIQNETGLVFPAGNIPALTEVLREAFQDPARLSCWGENARRKVQSYNYEAASVGLLSALEMLKVQK